jgi:hypothetical protein
MNGSACGDTLFGLPGIERSSGPEAVLAARNMN